MIEAVELLWFRCLDGYRLQEPSPEDIRMHEDAMTAWQASDLSATTLSLPPARPEPLLVPTSDVWVPYYASSEVARAKANLAELFVNTPNTPEGAVEFTSLFGPLQPPEGHEHEWKLPTRLTAPWREWLRQGFPLSRWSDFRKSIQGVVNVWHSGDHVRLADTFTVNDLGRSHAHLRRAAGGQMQFQIQPVSLKSLIWIEMARLIAGGATVRACRVCKKLMVVGGTAEGYSTREVCSHRCRMVEYRARQKAKLQREPARKDKKGRARA